MSAQIGATHEYTSPDESTSKLLAICPQCQTKGVPKGINSTRPGAAGEKHCPYCGWIYGREGVPVKVLTVNVTGAGGATTITVDNATLQMSAEVLPAIATGKTVTWSVVNGTGQATISASGLLTPVVGSIANGTVTVKATSNDVTKTVGSLVITLSNQV